MMKRIIGIAFALMMLVGLLSTNAFATSDITEIATVADLQAFAAAVNAGDTFAGKTVKLTADLDLAGIQWQPIGGSTTYFAGEFDGNGKTISNLTNTEDVARKGLFGLVEDCYIHDLTFKDVKFSGTAAGMRVGALAGNLNNPNWNGTGCIIKNVTVDGLDYDLTDNETGGFIGGLIGYAWNSYVKDCTVKSADINVTSIANACVGAMIGYGRGVTDNCYVEDFPTYGSNIEADDVNADGGVVNYVDCTVEGAVVNLNGTVSFGGFFAVDTYNHWRNTFKNCNVTGLAVTCAEGDGVYTVGGFMGKQAGGYSEEAIKDCSAQGTITSLGTNSDSSFAGFIGGEWGRTGGATNCTADVDITVAAGNVAGFVGSVEQYNDSMNYTFNGCTASGDVKTENGTASGFIAEASGKNLNVVLNNNTVSGTVEGTTTAALIGNVASATGKVAVSGNTVPEGLTEIGGNADIIEETLEISTVDELKAFAAAVNEDNNFAGKKVVLKADLTFGEDDYWYNNQTGVDYVIKNFAGTFDGNGHTITGMKYNFYTSTTSTGDFSGPAMGLFGTVEAEGAVKNLTLDTITADITIDGTARLRAGFGFLACSLKGTAENCHVKNVTVNTNGRIRESGAVFTGVSGTATNCTAENVNINSTSASGYTFEDMGGFAGVVTGKLDDCHIDGVSITADNPEYGSFKKVGGFIGRTNNNAVVNDCTAKNVTLSATTLLTYTGGFVGHAENSGSATYTNCSVEDVTIKTNNGRSTQTGGFVGEAYGVTFDTCDATDVTINVGVADSGKVVGSTAGFCGQTNSSGATFKSCDVTGLNMTVAGDIENGLGGFLTSTGGSGATIEGCTVEGTIDATDTNADDAVGGFLGNLGWGGAAANTITGSSAAVDITANGPVGGFVGKAESSNANATLAVTESSASGVLSSASGEANAFAGTGKTGAPDTEDEFSFTGEITVSIANGLDLTTLETTSGEGWAWDAETKTLTLSGINMETATSPAIKVPAGTTIVLANGSVNNIKTTAALGIKALGSLTVKTEDGYTAKGTLNITATDRGIVYDPTAAPEIADYVTIFDAIINIEGVKRGINASLDIAVPEGATPALTVTLNNVEYTDNATDRSIQAYNTKGDATLNIENSTVETTGFLYVLGTTDTVMNITDSTVTAKKIKLGWWVNRMDLAQLNVTGSTLVMTNINGSDAAIEVGVNGPDKSEAHFKDSTIIAANDNAAAISVSQWIPKEDRVGQTDAVWTVRDEARGELTITDCTMTLVGTKEYGDLDKGTVTGNSDITSVVGTTVTEENGVVNVTGVTSVTSNGNTYTPAEGSTADVNLSTGAATIPAVPADLVISTVDELKAFAAAVNAGDNFAGKLVKLGADIVFGEDDYWFNNETGVDFRITKDFAGTFDGNGHTISGLKFKNTDITKNPSMYLFSSISGTVENLTLDGVDADINDRDCFGFIAYKLTGTAENCHVKNVTVDVAVNASGTGYMYSSGAMFGQIAGAQVDSCTAEHVTFRPTGTDNMDNIGALIGTASGDGEERSTVTNCSVKDVNYDCTRKTKRTGGFIGGASNTDFTDCTVTDLTISVDTYYQSIGGFIGDASTNSTYTRCKVENFTLTGNSTDYAGDVGGFAAKTGSSTDIPVKFTDCSVTGLDMDLTCNDNSEWTAGGFLGYPTSNVDIDGCTVDGTIDVTGTGTNHELGSFVGTMDWTSQKDVTIDESTSTVPGDFIGENSFGNDLTIDGVEIVPTNWIELADTSWYVDGQTEFTVTTPEQLAGIAKLVNEGITNFQGITITLGGNIDLAGKEWTPIGTLDCSKQFMGTLNGMGYTISNLTIEEDYGDTKARVGLFSGLQGINDAADTTSATVFDLTLNGFDIKVSGSNVRAGALAGNVWSGTYVTAVYVKNGTIKADGAVFAGGLAGYVYTAMVSNVQVSNVTIDHTGTGTSYLGGVAGHTAGHSTYWTAESTNTMFYSCLSDGVTITSDASGTVYAGGMIGACSSYNGSTNSQNRCQVNNMTMNLAGDAQYIAGGFIGHQQGMGGDSNCAVQDTTITSTGTNANSVFGGFMGRQHGRGRVHEGDQVLNAAIDVANGNVGGFIGSLTVYRYADQHLNEYTFDNCDVWIAVSTENGTAGGFLSTAYVGEGNGGLWITVKDSEVAYKPGASADTFISGTTAGAFIGSLDDNYKSAHVGGNINLIGNSSAANSLPFIASATETVLTAKIGKNYYGTVKAALEAVKNGQTIELLSNATLSEVVDITDGEFTLALGDFDLTMTGPAVLRVKGDAKMTVTGAGDIKQDDGSTIGIMFIVAGNAELNLNTTGVLDAGLTVVQADGNAVANINSGIFSAWSTYEGKYYVLNYIDSAIETAEINLAKGVQFVGFDPAHAVSEPGGDFDFCGAGLTSEYNEATNTYTVVESKTLIINNLDELKAFRDAVNAGNTFEGKTILLAADIDLGNENWTPIGNTCNTIFSGTFDGQGHTISNLRIEATTSRQGFFGCAGGETIKNVTFHNAYVDSANGSSIAVVVGHGDHTGGHILENIKITGLVQIKGVSGMGTVIGTAPNVSVKASNIIVDVEEGSYVDSTRNIMEGYPAGKYYSYTGGVFGQVWGNSFTDITSNIDVIGACVGTGGITGGATGTWLNITHTGDVIIAGEKDMGYWYTNKDENGNAYGLIYWWQGAGLISGYHGGTTFENCVSTGTLTYQADNSNTNEIYYNATIINPETRETIETVTLCDSRFGSSRWGNDNTITVIDYAELDEGGEVVETYVAYIGEVGYTSIQAAIDATKDMTAGPIWIKLVSDVVENNIKIPADKTKNLYIDLDGHTLYGDIYNEGMVSIQDGTIKGTRFVSTIESYGADAELTVTDMEIISYRHAIRVEGGNAWIHSGTYKTLGKVNADSTCHAINAGGAIETYVYIYGGTFIGPKGSANTNAADSGAAVMAQAKAYVVINKGTFSGGQNDTIANSGDGSVVAVGGLYDQDPTAYVPTGYISEAAETEGWFKVVEDRAVAMIGDVKYDTVEAAFAAAKTGEKITLIKDCVATKSIKINRAITLELNGHTITADGVGIFLFQVMADFTVNGEGTIKATGIDEMFNVGNVTLTINDNVTLISEYSVIRPGGTATVAINGGTLTSEKGAVLNKTADYANTTITKAAEVAITAPEGYKWLNDTTLTKIVHVAEVNGIKYESLAEAIAVAKDGDTITVLDDYTVPEIVHTQYDKKALRKITTDLNGKKLSGSEILNIQTGTEVTITDTSAEKTGAVEGTIIVREAAADSKGAGLVINAGIYTSGAGKMPAIKTEGNLTVNDGKFNAGDKTNDYSIWIENGETVINGGEFTNFISTSDDNAIKVQKGKLTVNGGTFTSAKNAPISSIEGAIVITGGTFEGKDYAIRIGSNSELSTITGGTFTNHTENYAVIYAAEGYNLEVTGGIYNGARVVNYNKFIANGYVAKEIAPKQYEVVFEPITWAGKNLLYKDIIQMYFRFESSVQGVTEESFGLEVWDSNVDFNSVAPDATYTKFTENGKYWTVATDGISAKNMGDSKYIRAYVVMDGSKYYTETIEYSPALYAKDRYENSTSKETRELVIALVNYGTAAQNYFGYDVENPMNAFLSDADRADIYDESMVRALESVDTTKVESDTDFFTKIGKNVEFKGAINMSFRTSVEDIGSINLEESKLLYWNVSDYNANAELNKDNATNAIELEINVNYLVGKNSGISVKNLGDTGYYCFYVVDADGVGHYSELLAYSAHEYAIDRIANSTNANMQELARRFVVYTDKAVKALSSTSR